jgi:adenylate cyclase
MRIRKSDSLADLRSRRGSFDLDQSRQALGLLSFSQRNSLGRPAAVSRLASEQMKYEIERRFLVTGDGWRSAAVARIHMRQAYLNFDGTSSVRVRIEDGHRAVLTVKARGPALRRFEIEYPLPMADAEVLMQHRRGSIVEKTRHIVPHGGSTWEVDVFAGENAGLVVAEIELRDDDQDFLRPGWLGLEITGDARYGNSALAQRPFGARAHTGFTSRPRVPEPA